MGIREVVPNNRCVREACRIGFGEGLFADSAAAHLPTLGLGRVVVPRLVGAATLGVLGFAVLRASVGSFVLVGGNSTEGPLVVWGAALLAGSWLLYVVLSTDLMNPEQRRTPGGTPSPKTSPRPMWRTPFFLSMAVPLAIDADHCKAELFIGSLCSGHFGCCRAQKR